MASGTAPRSSRSTIRSAALMATSVPVPRASPRSAAASAGPSLIPVPDHGHPVAGWPAGRAIMADLLARERPGDHLIGAAWAPTACGGGLAVAGQQHGAQAQPAQPGHRRRGGRLDRVGDRDRPARPARPSRPAPPCSPPAAARATCPATRRGRHPQAWPMTRPSRPMISPPWPSTDPRPPGRVPANPAACGSGPQLRLRRLARSPRRPDGSDACSTAPGRSGSSPPGWRPSPTPVTAPLPRWSRSRSCPEHHGAPPRGRTPGPGSPVMKMPSLRAPPAGHQRRRGVAEGPPHGGSD